MHTDDGVHPQNTGPGDLAIGELRGNIITSSDTGVFSANVNATQQVPKTEEDHHLWDDVTATGTIDFHKHTDHIAFTLNVDGLHNVTGIHIHQGNSTENSSIHLVDLLTSTSSLLHHDSNHISSGPISHMHGEFTGEITVDDLCPGEHDHGGDDGHDDGHHEAHDFVSTVDHHQAVPETDSEATGTAEFDFNFDQTQLSYQIVLEGLDLGGQTEHDHDDVTAIHIHKASVGETGPHVLNIFGQPFEDDADMEFNATTGTITGIWDDSDENTTSDNHHLHSQKLSTVLEDLCSENLYLNIHTDDHPTGVIRGQILVDENSDVCEAPNYISGRAVSEHEIVIEFDKPMSHLHDHLITGLEMPHETDLNINQISQLVTSFGHTFAIIEVDEHIHEDAHHGEITISHDFTDKFGKSVFGHHDPFAIDNAQGHEPLTLTHDSPNLLLTEHSTLEEIVIEDGVDAILDISMLSTDSHDHHTTVTLPSNIKVIYANGTSNEVIVEFPAGLEITTENENFDTSFILASSCITEIEEPGYTANSCLEIGYSDAELSFSEPVKITFPGESNNLPYYKLGINSKITLIDNQCDTSNSAQVNGTIISSSGQIKECHANDGQDKVIWTTHATSFGSVSASASSSSSGSGSGGGVSGGGGSRSAILGPNIILYNACSEEQDGIMRIVTYNQLGRDLRVHLSFDDDKKWATNVSDKVSYSKYIDVPSEKYEYSVFEARFSTDLEQVMVGLHDTENKKRFLHHLVKFPSYSCLGSEVPFPLKDRDATYLKPFEPLEIPQPEVSESSPFKKLVSYEGKLAKNTFDLITEHKPVFQKFEDPNNLPYTPMPWNDSWNELKQCYEEGERNRHHCYFVEQKIPSQIEFAQAKFAEMTWSEPIRHNFGEEIFYNQIYRGAIWLGGS
jgi:hypothetical protein